MEPPVQIRLLGGFALGVGDTEVPEGAWRLRKGKSLVKLLALSPERRVHRDKATEWLWPDRTPDAAANNFHQALYVARRALEQAGADAATALPLKDDMLMLYPQQHVDIDVEEFEEAAAHARKVGTVERYRAALALYGGELLPEDRFEAWATTRREALNETHFSLLLGLADLLTENQDAASAIEALEQAVVLDPVHEAAQRALMRLFVATGRRQQALAQYHRLRAALKQEFAADPDPQTAELYKTLLRGETIAEPIEPAARAPRKERGPPTAPARHNLPLALTSFVGRGRELEDVDGLLDANRLVTLTGAGGSGKTRLAVEVARQRLDGCHDGVWLVELASLADPALVPQATASAIGLKLPAQRSELDELAARLREWRTLLILDNCEHLIGACAGLAEHLLGACPDLRILATSREPLRVPGGVTWRVPSLALPIDKQSAEQVAGYESVRLFCERAADVSPGFALDDGNAAAVAEICQRLDGMPLALELAAARTGALSPAQIVDRLGDSLAVLTAGSRAALDRQQTLRATLGWSHDLLTDEERVQFRRLAVFAGSFALEGAEAVTSDDALPEREVADLIARLVDKSLVITEDGPRGYRYRLLEPVRQYAQERLADALERPDLERRHYEFYLRLARTADPESIDTGGVGFDALEADHDNLRAALAWAQRHDPQRALRMAVHMWPMWMAGSHFKEGRRRLDSVLAAAPDPTALRAAALRAVAGLQIRLGQNVAVTQVGEERVEIFRELGDRAAVAHALDEAGVYHYMGGDFDQAERLWDESFALAEELGDPKVASAVLHSRAVLAQSRGDCTGAREALLEVLVRLGEIPQEEREPFFRVQTAGFFVASERPGAPPRMYFEETLQLFRRVDAWHARGYVLAALGDVARAQDLTEPARDRLTDSLSHFREARDPMGIAFALNRLGNLSAALGEHELGREWLEEALQLRREMGDRRGVGMTLGNLGVLAASAGDPERGAALVSEALEMFEATDDAAGQMGLRLSLGHVVADTGDAARARTLLLESRANAAAQGLHHVGGWATIRLAELEIECGQQESAAALIEEALDSLRVVGDQRGVKRCLELDAVVAKSSLSAAGEG